MHLKQAILRKLAFNMGTKVTGGRTDPYAAAKARKLRRSKMR